MDIKASFRAGMRRLASGVCVISTQSGDGQRFAMTASSVTSVSDAPPSLLVCIHRDAAIRPLMSKGQPFVVNLLSRDQQDISNRCAFGDLPEERFAIGDWLTSTSGLPYLGGCQATFFCETDNDNYFYGTHQIIVGRISAIEVEEGDIQPLVYLDGSYVDVMP